MPHQRDVFRSPILSGVDGLFAHYLDNDAFRALPVEFRVIDLLPRPEIQLPIRHRNDHLMVNQQALQVRIAVRLAGAVMAVILAKRRQFFQPLVDVRQQSVFGVVDPNARRNVHGRNQNHAVADSALFESGVHLLGNVDVLAMLFGVENEMFGVKAHTCR